MVKQSKSLNRRLERTLYHSFLFHISLLPSHSLSSFSSLFLLLPFTHAILLLSELICGYSSHSIHTEHTDVVSNSLPCWKRSSARMDGHVNKDVGCDIGHSTRLDFEYLSSGHVYWLSSWVASQVVPVCTALTIVRLLFNNSALCSE